MYFCLKDGSSSGEDADFLLGTCSFNPNLRITSCKTLLQFLGFKTSQLKKIRKQIELKLALLAS